MTRGAAQQPYGDGPNYFTDVGRGIARGVVGAAQGVYGLADYVTGDSLPDWDVNPIAETETMVGGMAEGLSQFLTGLVPGLGAASVLSKVGKAGALIGKGGKLRGTFLGAFSDFTAFDGNEARLANMVEDVPGLGVVAEFLAADEDDNEVVGRLKNVLEGLGLEMLMSTLVRMRPGWKKATEAKGRGENPDEQFLKDMEEAGVDQGLKTVRERINGVLSRGHDKTRKPLSGDLEPRIPIGEQGRIDRAIDRFSGNPTVDGVLALPAFREPDIPEVKQRYIDEGVIKNDPKFPAPTTEEFVSIINELDTVYSPGFIRRDADGKVIEGQQRFFDIMRTYHAEGVLDKENIQLLSLAFEGSNIEFFKTIDQWGTTENWIRAGRFKEEGEASEALGFAGQEGRSPLISEGYLELKGLVRRDWGGNAYIGISKERHKQSRGSGTANPTHSLAHELSHAAFYAAREVTTKDSKFFETARASDGIYEIYYELQEAGPGALEDFLVREIGLSKADPRYVEYVAANIDEFAAETMAQVLMGRASDHAAAVGLKEIAVKFWKTVMERFSNWFKRTGSGDIDFEQIRERLFELNELILGIAPKGEDAYEELFRLQEEIFAAGVQRGSREPGRLPMTPGRLADYELSDDFDLTEFDMHLPASQREVSLLPAGVDPADVPTNKAIGRARARFTKYSDLVDDNEFITKKAKKAAANSIKDTFEEIAGDQATRDLFEDGGTGNLLKAAEEAAQIALGTARSGAMDLEHGTRIAEVILNRLPRRFEQAFRDFWGDLRQRALANDPDMHKRWNEGTVTPDEVVLQDFDIFMGTLAMSKAPLDTMPEDMAQVLATIQNVSDLTLDATRAVWGSRSVDVARRQLLDNMSPVNMADVRGVSMESVENYKRYIEPTVEDAAEAQARVDSFGKQLERNQEVYNRAKELEMRSGPEAAQRFIETHLQDIANPRTLSAREQELAGVKKWHINTTTFLEGEEDIASLYRMIERDTKSAQKTVKGLNTQELADLAAKEIAYFTGRSLDDHEEVLKDLVLYGKDLVKKGEDFRVGAMAYRQMIMTVHDMAVREIQAAIPEGLDPMKSIENMTDATLIRLDYLLERVSSLYDIQMTMKNIKGAALRDERFPIKMIEQSQKMMDEAVKNRGGVRAMRQRLKKAYIAIQKDESLHTLSRIIDSQSKTRLETFGLMMKDSYIGSLLAGLRTIALQPTAGANIIFMPLERAMGAATMALLPGKGKGMVREMETAYEEIIGYGESFLDFFSIFAKTAMGDDSYKLLGRKEVMWDEAPSSIRSNVNAHNAGYVLDGIKFVRDAKESLSNAGGGIGYAYEAMAKTLGVPVDATGRVYQFIGDITQAPDLGFQQVMYQSIVKAQLRRRGVEQGLRGQDLKNFVDAEMKILHDNWQALTPRRVYEQGREIGKRQRLSGPELEEFAQTYARDTLSENDRGAIAEMAINEVREATFKTQFDNKFLNDITNAMDAAHPALGLWIAAPFKRTPLSILKFAIDRSPVSSAKALFDYITKMKLGGQTRSMLDDGLLKELLSEDPRTQAAAVGRVMTGIGLTTLAWQLASSGRITGSGPKNPEERALLMETGWMPNSYFIGDDPTNPSGGTYVSYMKLEQIAFPLSLVADMFDSTKYGVSSKDLEAGDFGPRLALALANNINSRSYMQGIARFFDFARGRVDATTYAKSIAAGFVPNTFDQLQQVDLPIVGEDPFLRETRDAFEAMRATIPGQSKALPVRRNFLGEPIKRRSYLGGNISSYLEAFSFIEVSEVDDDVIMDEMRLIGAGFSPPKYQRGGIDLRDITDPTGRSVYDRWQERTSTIRIDGKNLRGALKKLIKSAKYRKLEPASYPGQESPRKNLIRNVISRYREAAWHEEVRRNATLRGLERERADRRRVLRTNSIDSILR
jgi:hypothetical protein